MDEIHPLRLVLGDLPAQLVTRLHVKGLTADGVGRLLAGSGIDADEVMKLTNGNPLLVSEIARTGMADLPETLKDSVAARLARLPEDQRLGIKRLAVVPDQLKPDVASTLSGLSPSELSDLGRIGLLDETGGAIRFRHESVRVDEGAHVFALESPGDIAGYQAVDDLNRSARHRARHHLEHGAFDHHVL